jgi:hypothetical protein
VIREFNAAARSSADARSAPEDRLASSVGGGAGSFTYTFQAHSVTSLRLTEVTCASLEGPGFGVQPPTRAWPTASKCEARGRGNRANALATAGTLGAFENQLNAQTGKAFTDDDAATLLAMAHSLE